MNNFVQSQLSVTVTVTVYLYLAARAIVTVTVTLVVLALGTVLFNRGFVLACNRGLTVDSCLHATDYGATSRCGNRVTSSRR